MLSVGGVAPCRLQDLSYPGSLLYNKIGDGGAGAVAAAAGTLPCLERLGWVLVHFPLNLHFLLFPLSHQSLPLLEGHVMEDREGQAQGQGHELYLFKPSRNSLAVAIFEIINLWMTF